MHESPPALSVCSALSSAARAPDNTSRSGPLSAATARPSSCRFSSSRTVSALHPTESMPPPAASDSTNRPRQATNCSPASRSKTPATQAATYSPRLCPATKAGSTPQWRQSAANAYATENSAGCNIDGALRRVSSSAKRASSIEPGTCARSRASHCSSVARKWGSASKRSRPNCA